MFLETHTVKQTRNIARVHVTLAVMLGSLPQVRAGETYLGFAATRRAAVELLMDNGFEAERRRDEAAEVDVSASAHRRSASTLVP